MRRQIPTITALLCFEAAARTENFAKAAREINITQSALSRQIQALESFTQQTLFTRNRQRVKLTLAGKTLSAELIPLLEKLEGTLFTIRSHNNQGGTINVGVYPTLGSRWLMPRFLKFAEANDKLTLNTITYLSNSAIDPSLVDLAIVQGSPPWPGFRVDFLMGETMVVVCSPKLMKKPLEQASQLLENRVLLHSTRPKSWEIWSSSIDEQSILRPTGPMFSQFEMLIDAVKGGHGVAIIPSILVQKELFDGTLIKAHSHECTTESAYYLLTPKVKIGIRRIEMFRQWFLDQSRP
ncbi:Transcriptional regulator, LysR family [hydrothermal vent metagenome]|uniref:Transcriptional regulator, LysR family n=1 Tax=hydrothermal vent metagenome TaxID=652676 RepID=A0A3B0U2F2_9ZZZZ